MPREMQYLQAYASHNLQHVAGDLCKNTNFKMLFLVEPIYFALVAHIEIAAVESVLFYVLIYFVSERRPSELQYATLATLPGTLIKISFPFWQMLKCLT